jgi:hypothetical protein
MVAILNVEAEVLCAKGDWLVDSRGNELPSIVDGLMSRHDLDELLEAARVARGLAEPKIGIPVTSPFPGPMLRSWDLDSLLKVFERASISVAAAAKKAIATAKNVDVPFEDRLETIVPASREECLWSSLLHLAGACAILKVRYLIRRNRLPTGNA